MDFNLLCKALDEISQDRLANQVVFHVMGEPTLYPHLVKAVVYAKDRGLKVHLTTNGALMTDDVLDGLLGTNIDHILFSVQTPGQRSFSLRRANIDFYEYKKRVTSLIAKILQKGKDTVATVSFLSTPFKWLILPSRKFRTIDNKKMLLDYANLWIGDVLSNFNGCEVRKEVEDGLRGLRGPMMSSNLLGWNRFKVSNKLFIEVRPVGDWIHPSLFSDRFQKARIGCCEGIEKHFGILWNGDLVFCCVDFDGKTAFANISKSTIKESFRSKLVQSAIEGFKRLRVSHPYCQRCLGDVSLTGSLARQVGSIFYFKWYRNHWPGKEYFEKVASHA
jgi:hypothetical protein